MLFLLEILKLWEMWTDLLLLSSIFFIEYTASQPRRKILFNELRRCAVLNEHSYVFYTLYYRF